MFYRLTQIEGGPLPGPLAFNGRRRVIVEGGLLLVPPGAPPRDPRREGYAILSVSGPPCPDGSPGWALTWSALYRWTVEGGLVIAQDEYPGGGQLVGARDGETVVLRPGGPGGRVAVGDLTFVEACHDPPDEGWRRRFWGGPREPEPRRRPGDDADAYEASRQRHAEREREWLAESARQLAAAWCASA